MKLSARKGLKPDYVVNQLLTSGLDSDLADYFGIFTYGYHEELVHTLLEFVTDKMRDHRLEGVAA